MSRLITFVALRGGSSNFAARLRRLAEEQPTVLHRRSGSKRTRTQGAAPTQSGSSCPACCRVQGPRQHAEACQTMGPSSDDGGGTLTSSGYPVAAARHPGRGARSDSEPPVNRQPPRHRPAAVDGSGDTFPIPSRTSQAWRSLECHRADEAARQVHRARPGSGPARPWRTFGCIRRPGPKGPGSRRARR